MSNPKMIEDYFGNRLKIRVQGFSLTSKTVSSHEPITDTGSNHFSPHPCIASYCGGWVTKSTS